MTIKMKQDEFNFLYSLVRDTSSVATQGMHISKRLLHSVVKRIHKKFHQRALDVKRQISITLTDDEAITFYLLFSNHGYDKITWEGNLLNGLCFQINQIYA
jgi:uncharacterized protein YtpQ (UPF0354 family)